MSKNDQYHKMTNAEREKNLKYLVNRPKLVQKERREVAKILIAAESAGVFGAGEMNSYAKRITGGQKVEWLKKGGNFLPLALRIIATEDSSEQFEDAHHRHRTILGTAGGKSLHDLGISAHGGDADVGIQEVDHRVNSAMGGSSP